jgi:hypothetical protein
MTARDWCASWAVTPKGWESIEATARKLERELNAFCDELKTESDWSRAYQFWLEGGAP